MNFNRLTQLGWTPDLSAKEQKRVVLLNKLALVGIIINLSLGISVYLMEGMNSIYIVVLHLLASLGLILTVVIHAFRHYVLARIILWLVNFVVVFIFSRILKTDIHNEYYFAVFAVLPLLFFDRKVIVYTGLILSCFAFYSLEIIDLFRGEYNDTKAGNSTFVLFTLLFLIVNYFKTLNQKNEKALEAQKNKALEDAAIIEEQRRELEELNKFQNHFFVNISHEIRTPLTLIMGNNSKVTRVAKNEGLALVGESAKAIDEQANKIRQIVDDVLDLAKLDIQKLNINRKPILANSFFTKIFQSFHSTFQHKDITFLFNIEEEKCAIEIDTVFFERAINNLLTNALKYTDEGGKVVFSISKKENHLLIKVQDTGIGIPTNDIEKIFNRFYQSDNDINHSGGSGIGLAFSKEVIELHEGNVWVESEEGVGTIFFIELPIAEQVLLQQVAPDVSTIVKEDHLVKQSVGDIEKVGKKTILVVDDHSDMRTYIVSLLPHYHCLEASNGLEALDIIQKKSVDFLITDYMMPKMDGYALITSLKKQAWNKPIVMLTARVDLEGKLGILRLGIDDYLTKPFHQEELQIRIENGFQNHQNRQTFNVEIKEEIGKGEDDLFMEKLQSIIEKECERLDFGINDLVHAIGISQSSLYRKIKSLTGLSTNDFIREVKLQKGRALIEQKTFSTVKQVAYAVGFQKTSHFSKLYVERFGVKPFEETDISIGK